MNWFYNSVSADQVDATGHWQGNNWQEVYGSKILKVVCEYFELKQTNSNWSRNFLSTGSCQISWVSSWWKLCCTLDSCPGSRSALSAGFLILWGCFTTCDCTWQYIFDRIINPSSLWLLRFLSFPLLHALPSCFPFTFLISLSTLSLYTAVAEQLLRTTCLPHYDLMLSYIQPWLHLMFC